MTEGETTCSSIDRLLQRARTTLDRNVLEWRLDPTSPHRLRSLEVGAGTRIILVCHEGYGSSLAAATLRHLGLRRATALIDGFRGWLAHRDAEGRADERGSTYPAVVC